MSADAAAASTSGLADLQRRVDELAAELQARDADYQEALLREAAIAELLQVINASPGDVAPVFAAMLERASRLCAAPFGQIVAYDGESFRFVALHGKTAFTEQMPRTRLPPSWGVTWPRLLAGEDVVHMPDVMASELFASGHDATRKFVELGGGRTLLTVSLRKDARLLGALTVYRQEVCPFSDRQIALLQNFAAQAVIAMENARLLSELRESLERQTATTEVLETINNSPGDLQPVFEAILTKAMILCDAAFGTFATFDGQRLHTVTTRGVPEAFARYRTSNPPEYGTGTGPARLIAGEAYVHDFDAADSEAYRRGDPNRRAIVELGGVRTILNVALRKDDVLLGTISIYRQEVKPFSDNQIALLQNFAAQAVIAMENARLLGELRRRTEDLTQSLEYQTATSEVLEVISRSTTDIQPVLDRMLAAATRLCGALAGTMAVRQGDKFRHVASVGLGPVFDRALRERPLAPRRGTISERVLLEKQIVHIADLETDPDYPLREANTDRMHTALGVPLMREGEPLGVFVLARSRIEPFTERQIALVKTFADQAVIAMENTRLLGELRESLDQQTATAEVLAVINSSPGNLVPVFSSMLEEAMRLCGASFGELRTYDGRQFHLVAAQGVPAAYADYYRSRTGTYGPGTGPARILAGEQVIHVPDLVDTEPYRHGDADRVALVELAGARANLVIPLRKGAAVIGFIMIYRREVGAFSDKQITLLQNFAAQAVIAMENARLLTETREALEQQTATAEILTVISRSPTDVGPVLTAVAKAATKFCGAGDAQVALREGDDWIVAAHEGPIGALLGRRTLTRHTAPGRAMIDGKVVQIVDLQTVDADEFPEARELGARLGFRSAVAAPLLRDNVAIGAISLRRSEAGEFAPRQIELLKTFAAQAVIAIENVRLFTELRESLDQQTATAEILRAISQSPTDVRPVLDAVVKAALRFCGATDAIIVLREGEGAFFAAHEGPLVPAPGSSIPLNRETSPGRAILDGRTCHLPDIASLDPVEFATAHRLAAAQGFRAAVAAPLLREGTAIGAVALRKSVPGPYAPQQIELLETFAAQAVIAIENVRLFTELRDSLERLKAAQANLIQSEKMASLGQLTAGIAHEIKNPLNFVNNFASLSVELLDEFKEMADPALATLGEDKRAELDETMSLLIGNLGKITEHGKRADGIVKSMLSHSRGGAGDWQPSDISALVEEALNLAYHGARAQDKEFNVTLERDFEKAGTPIEVVPQDVTRVFLNLFGNGFYAANKRRTGASQAGFRPTLKVTTRDLGDSVEVRVRDNGIGMPPEVKEKLFQPFFTTKPTGEGTGLGLSISYDIVTQQHGGTIEVESEPNNYTEFTVRLPRARRVAEAARGSR